MSLSLSLGGFGNAPVTKGLLLTTAAASVLHQSSKSSIARHAIGPVARLLVFKHPGELILGVILIYYFRSLERRAGSSKFACFLAFATGASLLIQAALSKLARNPAIPSGPYGFIFASFAQYYFDFPPTSHFGWKLNNKSFFYGLGMQLVTSGGMPTILAGTAGLFAGLLYRLDFLGVKRLKMPAPVARFFSRLLGPFLVSPTPQIIQPGSSTRVSRRTGARASRAAVARPAAAVTPPPPQSAVEPSPDAVAQLMDMGFDRERVEQALVASGNDVNAALNQLLVS